jgi:hypothetical protein
MSQPELQLSNLDRIEKFNVFQLVSKRVNSNFAKLRLNLIMDLIPNMLNIFTCIPQYIVV